MVEILLEEKENQTVHHYCFVTDSGRYDFTIVFSNYFCGKAMVISLQSGKMMLMCKDDLVDDLFLSRKLGIDREDVGPCRNFFSMLLSQHYGSTQY